MGNGNAQRVSRAKALQAAVKRNVNTTNKEKSFNKSVDNEQAMCYYNNRKRGNQL